MRTHRLVTLTPCAVTLVALLATGATVRGSQEPRALDGSAADRGRPGEPGQAAVPIDAPAPGPDEPAAASNDLPLINGPDAPVPPAVVARDERGRATVRAVRLPRPLQIDGRLDDEIYQTVPPIGDMYQQLPQEGAAATEPTEMWIFFDDENLYISVRCSDSQPRRLIATELRRDASNLWSADDNISVALDTMYDRRNGFLFQTNPLGAIRDQAIVDGQNQESWNTIWGVKSMRSAEGWASEMVIPFKSLRYRRAGPQVWGINFRRIIRWKNEYQTLTAVPASYGGMGISQMGVAGTLVGVETPAQSMNLEIKPYAASSLTTDRTAAVPFNNDLTRSAGFDFKYGLTRSLIADVTVNTDFAQIEEDLQQVNLTRFSLFFPEKRDFFLEGQGIFAFGGRSTNAYQSSSSNVPVLFFSRRIGLSNGQSVPVIAGARVTGRTGPFEVGLLNIQTAEKEAAGAASTNFSAVRIKRDIFRRSSFGIIATERRPSAGDANLAVGADLTLRFYDNLQANAYYARTRTADVSGDTSSYRGQFEYTGDRYGVSVEHLMVGGQFDPAVGFLRREDFRRSFASGRFSPRPRASRLVRKLTWQGSVDYVTDARSTRLENRSLQGGFGIEFHSGDIFEIQYGHEYELLPQDFRIATGVTVPAGGYESDNVEMSYNVAGQRKISGRATAAHASFYEGTKSEARYSGRIGFIPQFSLEPSVSLNWVDLPYGNFTAAVLSTRVMVTPTPHLIVSSLIQLNTSNNLVSSSLRFRWEYVPGSDLFVVYSDGRDTSRPGFPELLNRSLAVKITRLVRF